MDRTMLQSDLSRGQAFSDLVKLISRNWQLCLLAVLLMTLANSAVHIAAAASYPEAAVQKPNFLVTLFTVTLTYIIGYLFVTRLMLTEGMTDHSWSSKRMLSFLSVGAFTVLGAIFCIVLSVIPGVNTFIRLLLVIPAAVVVIRCILAPCFVVGNQMIPTEAIKASWTVTRGQGLAVFITLLLMGTLIKVAALALALFTSTESLAGSASEQAMLGLWDSLSAIVSFSFFVAIYALLAAPKPTLPAE